MTILAARSSPTGLTPFLCGLVTATDAQLAKAMAAPDKVAARHGLSEAVVRFNLDWWRVRK